MLEGPRTRPEKLPEIGAVSKTEIPSIDKEVEAGQFDEAYGSALAGKPAPEQKFGLAGMGDASDLFSPGRMDAGLDPATTNPEKPVSSLSDQAERTHYDTIPETKMSFAGRPLRPQDFETAREVERLQEELKLAIDKSMTFGGRLTPGWAQDRINKIGMKLEMAQSKLASRTPQEQKLGDEMFRRNVDSNNWERVAAATVKGAPGQGIYDPATRETGFPWGREKESAPKPPHVRWVTDDQTGKEYKEITDSETGKTVSKEETGFVHRIPKDPNDPNRIHHAEPIIVRDKDGKPVLDENGNEKTAKQWYNIYNQKIGAPVPVEVEGGRARGRVDKTEAELAKKYDKTQVKAKDWESAVQQAEPGVRLRNPKDGKLYLIVKGGAGNKAVVQ